MSQQAFQDLWPELYSHCFGCGRNNEQGLQILIDENDLTAILNK